MIQLKPGLQPTNLAKNRKPLARRPRTVRKKRRGLHFSPVFSDPGICPFAQQEWERRTAEITDDSGKVIFKQEEVEVPKNWSPLATKIAVSKYFYGDIANGVDPRKGGRENSIRQLIHRVTRTLSDWGMADGYFASAETAEIFYDELTWLCLNQHAAFNSPSGSTSGFTISTASARTPARAITFIIAPRAQRNAPRPNTSTPKAV